MPEPSRQLSDIGALAAVCSQRWGACALGDIRFAVGIFEAAGWEDLPGVAPVNRGAEVCSDRPPVVRMRAARLYAENLRETHGIIPDSVLAAARREIARRESAAAMARRAAGELADRVSESARNAGGFASGPACCKRSPRSGIRGRACPIVANEIAQIAGVSRDQRPVTAVSALASGCRTLALNVAPGPAGAAVVTETALAHRDGRAVVTETATVYRDGRAQTRGRRGGSNRRRRKGNARRSVSAPVVEYVTPRK